MEEIMVNYVECKNRSISFDVFLRWCSLNKVDNKKRLCIYNLWKHYGKGIIIDLDTLYNLL